MQLKGFYCRAISGKDYPYICSHMRIYCLLFLLLLSCNEQRSSEENREAIRKGIEMRKPVKISQEQIITRAFEEARQDLKDTVVTKYQWKTYYVRPADSDSTLAELWMAYKDAVEKKAAATDNVQLMDSLIIYTIPIVRNDSLQQMLVAFMTRKEIVLQLTTQ